jgi:hypothetical protein
VALPCGSTIISFAKNCIIMDKKGNVKNSSGEGAGVSEILNIPPSLSREHGSIKTGKLRSLVGVLVEGCR